MEELLTPLRHKLTAIFVLLSATISIISALIYMFMLGTDTSTSLSWNNHSPNLLAPAVNYYPQELLIKGNCRDLSNLPAGRLFTTVPATEMGHIRNPDTRDAISSALTIDKTLTSEIVVSSAGHIILDLDTNSCQNFQLLLKQHSITTSIDNHQSTVANNALPRFLGFFSPNSTYASGLSLSVIIHNRFEQHPTVGKKICGIITLLSVIITACLLARLTPRRVGREQMQSLISYPTTKSPQRAFLRFRNFSWDIYDLIVIIVLGVWHFIGANTADDGYILTMIKERSFTGYDPNYFRWFGAGESPFGWFYIIYHWLDFFGEASFWLRLPELFCGIVSWFIISQGILPRLRIALSLSAPSRLSNLANISCFLVYWCTFNNGIRPESIIACGTALVIWLALITVQQKKLLTFYLCGISAALTLSCGPTAIIIFAPIIWLLLSCAPCFQDFFQALSLNRAPGRFLTILCLVISAGAATIPVAFYFIDFNTFLHKALMQTQIGPNFHWFEEYLRYNLLFSYTPDGAMPRRIAVLSTFLALTYIGLFSWRFGPTRQSSEDTLVIYPENRPIRRKQSLPQSTALAKFTLICIGTFILLSLTPTKPTHHFGAFAVIGTLAIACATSLPTAQLLNTFYKKILWLTLVLGVTAFAYTGPNSYWFVSSAHILWSNIPIRLGSSLGTIFGLVTGLIGFFSFISAFYKSLSQRETPSENLIRDTEQKHDLRTLTEISEPEVSSHVDPRMTDLLMDKSTRAQPQKIMPQNKYFLERDLSKTSSSHPLDSATVSTDQTISLQAYTRNKAWVSHWISGWIFKWRKFLKRNYADIIHFFSLRILPGMLILTLVIEVTSFSIPAAATLIDMHHAPYSVAKGNFMALRGDSGNLASAIYTESPYNRGLLSPVDPSDPENIGKTYKNYSPAHVPPALLADDEEETVTELSDLTQAPLLKSYNSNNLHALFHLPFGLPPNTPYTGNYLTSNSQSGIGNSTGIMSTDTDLVTGWYRLPKIKEHRLLILSVAGNASISAEFANDLGGVAIATAHFIDPYPGEKWRNIFLNLHDIPQNPKYIRILVESNNTRSWVVLTAPRAPRLITLRQLIRQDPVLIDWVVGLGFPTLRPFSIAHGIQEAPLWRITPDRKLFDDASHWEDSRSGGPLGLIAGYLRVIDWPTYMLHPLGGHYIALERYIPYLPYTTIRLNN